MNRGPAAWTGGVVVVLLIVGVLIVALQPGNETVVVDTSTPVTPPDDGSPVVHTLGASGGLAQFRRTDHRPHPQRRGAVPGRARMCRSRHNGDVWPTSHAECAHPSELVGEVAGLGITSSGQSLVGVSFAVPRGCYERPERGMAWPPAAPECAK